MAYENILSLDQASNKTGFAIYSSKELSKHGVFDISDIDKKHFGDNYYHEKVTNVKMFLDRCIKEFNIDLVILEDIQKQTNIKTFKDLAYLQGVLKNYCYENNIPFSVLSPSEWRSGTLHIKGRKREDAKKNTQDYVKKQFGIEASEDECDAIGIGSAGVKLLDKGKLEIFK